MLIGANFSHQSTLNFLQCLFNEGKIDFIEILIDNVVQKKPEQLKKMFGDIPVAFHIMNSDFISNNTDPLTYFAAQIRRLRDTLDPIYISDHLGMHSYQTQRSPIFLECNYKDDKLYILEKINQWRLMIDHPLYLENFASQLGIGKYQPEFMLELSKSNICDILFDFSNAVLAATNCHYSVDAWNSIAKQSHRFHISSFRHWSNQSSILIDSHDKEIDKHVFEFFKKQLTQLNQFTQCSIVVEHDDKNSLGIWETNIRHVKQAIDEVRL